MSGSRPAPLRRLSSEWASELVSGHWRELCAHARKRSGCDVDQAQDIAAGAILLLISGHLDAELLTRRQALGQMKNVIGKRSLQWLDRRRRRGTVELPEALPDKGAADPARTAELSELRSLMEEAWRQLPPAERRVVELCDLHGMKPRDVARESGRSVKTVHQQLWKGRARMRARLLQHIQGTGDGGDE